MVAEQAHASQRIGDDEMQKATAVSQRIPSTSCRSLRARRPRLGQMEEARAARPGYFAGRCRAQVRRSLQRDAVVKSGSFLSSALALLLITVHTA
jgi:hypothetical protein